MHPRALQLIALLKLKPHPEGGHYRRIHRSSDNVQPADGRPERPALTTIYFLLTRGEKSRWHRVLSDEIWHFYEGDSLELLNVDRDFRQRSSLRLGPLGEECQPVRVVPAGAWQAARTTGDYTLVGCTVGPGFDFADFTLLADSPESAAALANRHPDLMKYA